MQCYKTVFHQQRILTHSHKKRTVEDVLNSLRERFRIHNEFKVTERGIGCPVFSLQNVQNLGNFSRCGFFLC